ncbi:MAG TPA: hypothetical protein VNG90_01975 [Candidatus Acidoferrum sp.]|nr:hypothetical protein [Candidatus Acidoferrum sp.]
MPTPKKPNDAVVEPIVLLEMPLDYLSGASEALLDQWTRGLEVVLSKRHLENIQLAVKDRDVELGSNQSGESNRPDLTQSTALTRRYLAVMAMPSLEQTQVASLREGRAKEISEKLAKDYSFAWEAWTYFASLLPRAPRRAAGPEWRD